MNTGHSSTSISGAMGIAKAKYVNSVIGESALAGWISFKVLNHFGSSQIKMIVLLNDNEISICKNMSGINIFLIKLRTRKKYI